MRRLKVVDLFTIDEALEAPLAPGEFRDVFRLDLIAAEQLREPPGAPQIWLAIEILSVVDRDDMDRVWRRAGLIRRTGYPALPVAAGEQATSRAEGAIRNQNVILMRDGREKFWDKAVSAWINPP